MFTKKSSTKYSVVSTSEMEDDRYPSKSTTIESSCVVDNSAVESATRLPAQSLVQMEINTFIPRPTFSFLDRWYNLDSFNNHP